MQTVLISVSYFYDFDTPSRAPRSDESRVNTEQINRINALVYCAGYRRKKAFSLVKRRTYAVPSVSVLMLRWSNKGKWRKERLRRVDEARSVCFVSAGGAMINDAVNDILLDRHFGGSIETT